MPPMKWPNMLTWGLIFFLGGMGDRGYVGIIFQNFIPTHSWTCSPRVFPIATYFYPICLIQSSLILTYIGDPKGSKIMIEHEVNQIISSCEHNKFLGFWFLFQVAINFLHANGGNYSVTMC
jgi:hypothetical protein